VLVRLDWLNRDLAQLSGTVRNATDMAEHHDVPKHTASGWIRPAAWLSIALAVVIELPLAFLLLNATRRLWWVRTRERRRR
jgi:hypothetical protein